MKGRGKGPPPPPPPLGQGPKRPSAASLSVPGILSAGAADLSQIKLKQTKDKEVPTARFNYGGFDSPEAIQRYQRYVQRFNIECWLEKLGSGKATFATAIEPISREEAHALILLYKHDEDQEVLEKATALLSSMTARFQDVMSQLDQGSGCMVKTSSRSAKDTAEPSTIRRKVQEVLDHFSGPDENALMVALSYAAMDLLHMRTAAQAMDIFVKSERIWHDMHLALAQEVWDESLVARAWVHLEPDMEFRCFIAGGRLTGISQYRHFIYFPRVVALHRQIQAGIVDFIDNTIQPKVAGTFPDDNYVADLVVELVGGDVSNIMLGDLSSRVSLGRWWCVEINPFFETTDGALFSWRMDRDLLEGERDGAELVFRFNSRSQKGGLANFGDQWKSAVEGLLRESCK